MAHNRRQLERFAKELGVFPGQNDPAQPLVDAAAKDIPVVIKDVGLDQYVPTYPKAECVVAARSLAAQLRKRGHSEQVASWAVYKLIETGRLEAEIAEIQLPSPQHRIATSNELVVGESAGGEVVQNRLRVDEVVTAYLVPPSSAPGRAVEARLPEGQPPSGACNTLQYLVVWPTEELWAWFRSSPAMIPSLTCEEPEQDGPVESLLDSPHAGHLRWQGKLYRFSGISWKLLNCLWGRERVSYAVVGEQVWGNDLKPDGTIGSAVSRLNEAMSNHGIPLEWHRRNKHVLRCE